MYSFKVDNMLEVPTHQNIYAINCRRCDVLRIHSTLLRHNTFFQICFCQVARFFSKFYDFYMLLRHGKQNIANSLWCQSKFSNGGKRSDPRLR
jgi:hypothetical protein